jgi:hypothetical protein
MIAGLEQNVVALLGSRSSQALLRLMPHADLALACVALVVALHGAVWMFLDVIVSLGIICCS